MLRSIAFLGLIALALAVASNSPPCFTTLPEAVFLVGKHDRYDIVVTSSPVSTITATAPGSLSWQDKGTNTACISGTPITSDTGSHTITVSSSNSAGSNPFTGTGTVIYPVNVNKRVAISVNTPPDGATFVLDGQLLSTYVFTATVDPGTPTFAVATCTDNTYSSCTNHLTDGTPFSGFTFTDDTNGNGAFAWTGSGAALGTYYFKVSASVASLPYCDLAVHASYCSGSYDPKQASYTFSAEVKGHLQGTIKDSTPTPRSGWTVELYNPAVSTSSFITTATSDSNGVYHFDSLTQGTLYILRYLPSASDAATYALQWNADNSDLQPGGRPLHTFAERMGVTYGASTPLDAIVQRISNLVTVKGDVKNYVPAAISNAPVHLLMGNVVVYSVGTTATGNYKIYVDPAIDTRSAADSWTTTITTGPWKARVQATSYFTTLYGPAPRMPGTTGSLAAGDVITLQATGTTQSLSTVFLLPTSTPTTVSGTVKNSVSNNPINNIRVDLKDNGQIVRTVYTNTAGFYSINALRGSAYVVCFSDPSWTSQCSSSFSLASSPYTSTQDAALVHV